MLENTEFSQYSDEGRKLLHEDEPEEPPKKIGILNMIAIVII